MNVSSRTAFQVGLLIVGAIVLFAACWIFFNGQIRKDDTYDLTFLFNDAQGISKQGDVYLSGVQIGAVTSVGLSPDSVHAEVHVQIQKRYHIPVGSTISITASLLGGAASVNIMPPPRTAQVPTEYIAPNAVVAGQQSLTIAAIQAQAGNLMGQFSKTAAKANGLLDQATRTAASVNALIADPRLKSSLYATLGNLNQASQQGLLLTHDLRSALATDNQQIEGVIGNVSGTTSSIKGAVQENRGQLKQIVSNLNQTTAQLSYMTNQANLTLEKGQTLRNLSDTVQNLKAATVKMNSILENVSSLTADPKVQAELKDTLHNADVASTGASSLVERLNAISGGHAKAPGKGNLVFQSRLDFTQNFRTNKFRTDFDLYAPLSSTDFARVGVYDLTESNELNLQYGQVSPYNKLLTYRAGIYASKVGIGADYDLFGGRTFSVDLYNPNRLQLDARERIPLNANSGIWFGLEDVPRTNAVTLGFELQR